MNTIRVFFAINLPSPTCDFLIKPLAALKKAFPGHSIRWTVAQHLHVTLQFLSALPQEQLASLIDTVRIQLKNRESFQLQLGHLEAFPTQMCPRIISLTVEPQTMLMDLSNEIGQVMRALGYPVEPRSFKGHVTLGRLPQDVFQVDLLTKTHFPVIPPIPVHEIYLIESRPDAAGARYITLAQFPLNQNK